MKLEARICKGPYNLPILELPDDGMIIERLSPGTIREEDYYENFRWVADKLFACPRGRMKRGKCTRPLRLLRIRHPKSKRAKLLRDCASGALAKRRADTIEKILSDIDGLSGLEGSLTVARFVTVATLVVGAFGALFLIAG